MSTKPIRPVRPMTLWACAFAQFLLAILVIAALASGVNALVGGPR